MNLAKCERYYIKIKEVYLLLAGLEVSSIYGIASNEEAVPTKEEMHRLLVSLYQKQIIDWEEEKIAVKQPYADIFEILSISKRCVVIKSGTKKEYSHCCYFAKSAVVIIEKSQREEEMLCVFYMTVQEWLFYVKECLEIEEKNLEESVKIILEVKDSRTGREYGKITMIEQGLKTIAIEEIACQKKQWIYQEKELEQKLKILLWEEER